MRRDDSHQNSQKNTDDGWSEDVGEREPIDGVHFAHKHLAAAIYRRRCGDIRSENNGGGVVVCGWRDGGKRRARDTTAAAANVYFNRKTIKSKLNANTPCPLSVDGNGEINE